MQTYPVEVKTYDWNHTGLNVRKHVFGGLRTTKAQTSLRSLSSAFVIHVLKSIISRLAMSEILIFQVVSVDEQASLNLTLTETPKTGFLTLQPILS